MVVGTAITCRQRWPSYYEDKKTCVNDKKMREKSMKLEEWKREHLKKNKDRTKREVEG